MQQDDLVRELRIRLGADTGTFDEVVANPIALFALRLLVGESVDQMVELVKQRDEQMQATAAAMEVMARIGWAPSAHMPHSAIEVAVAAIASGADDAEVDLVVEQAWAQSPILASAAMRVGNLGAVDDGLRKLATQRSRLLSQAWEHHKRGEYAASIPIVLAQVDGITHDATTSATRPSGLSLFSASKKVDTAIADDETVAGMNAALPTVRDWFFATAVTTSVQGSLNRHAVLHGRELAYDTHLNSVKAFVLLVAVWEWASRKLDHEAARRKQTRYDQHAGSNAVDENGWRNDRRGFPATRDTLRRLPFAHRSLIQRNGRTATLDELTNDVVTKLVVKASEAVNHRVEPDGTWWASCESEAGWVFAIGGVPGDDHTYYADCDAAPTAPPPGPGWRTVDDGNWSGDCRW